MTFVSAFISGILVALPLFTLGLAVSLVIILPVALGVGALVASFNSWALAQLLNSPDGRQGFLPILIRGESTVMALYAGILLLALSGLLFVPWIVTIPIAMAVIAYRVSWATYP